MIGVERLTTILQTIAVSSMVKNGNPISATLIAPSDAGKSELLSKALPPNARVINDFTTASMTTILSEPKPPTWIVVPDFNSVISHKPAVATLTMAFLLALLAEGVTEIPGVDQRAKLIADKFKARGLRIALLTGMTPDMFHSRRGKWRSTGLLRRLVPIYYSYSTLTVSNIQETIRAGADLLDYSIKRRKRMRAASVTITETHTTAIQNLSQSIIANQLVWHIRKDDREVVLRGQQFPFSLHKTLRVYIRAHALMHGRHVTTKLDLQALYDFSKFIRYDHPEEI